MRKNICSTTLFLMFFGSIQSCKSRIRNNYAELNSENSSLTEILRKDLEQKKLVEGSSKTLWISSRKFTSKTMTAGGSVANKVRSSPECTIEFIAQQFADQNVTWKVIGNTITEPRSTVFGVDFPTKFNTKADTDPLARGFSLAYKELTDKEYVVEVSAEFDGEALLVNNDEFKWRREINSADWQRLSSNYLSIKMNASRNAIEKASFLRHFPGDESLEATCTDFE